MKKKINLKTLWKKWFWKETFLSVIGLSMPFVLSKKYFFFCIIYNYVNMYIFLFNPYIYIILFNP